MVADFNAHTPTAAAEIAVPSYQQLVNEHYRRVNYLITAIKLRYTRESDRLEALRSFLQRFPHTSRQLLQVASHCHLLGQKLLALDPNAVLQRGYAVVRENDRIVRSSDNLFPEQELTVQLAQGCFKVKVIEILNDF